MSDQQWRFRLACADLVAEYAFAVNAWDLDAFTDLFLEDGIWQRPGNPPLVGRSQIRAFMETQPTDRVLRHVNGACLVAVTGAETATIRSQTVVYEASGTTSIPAPLQATMVVEYVDEVRHDGKRVRFARRDTTVVFRGTAE